MRIEIQQTKDTIAIIAFSVFPVFIIIFPDKIVVKVFEKEPIAILIDKYQKKYYYMHDLGAYRRLETREQDYAEKLEDGL